MAGEQLPKINVIRAEHGVDPDAIFRGYIVRMPDDDSFLEEFDDDVGRAKICKTPDRALRFGYLAEAMAMASWFSRPAEAAALFETQRQLLVAAVAGNEAATAAADLKER